MLLIPIKPSWNKKLFLWTQKSTFFLKLISFYLDHHRCTLSLCKRINPFWAYRFKCLSDCDPQHWHPADKPAGPLLSPFSFKQQQRQRKPLPLVDKWWGNHAPHPWALEAACHHGTYKTIGVAGNEGKLNTNIPFVLVFNCFQLPGSPAFLFETLNTLRHCPPASLWTLPLGVTPFPIHGDKFSVWHASF